jgi:xanthine dehydrogenase accessory factor
MMLDVYRKLMSELDEGRPVVCAAIIGQAGSSPRSLGTKFLICQDGGLAGSIGGGLIEARVIQTAKALMNTGRSLVMEIRMSGDEVAGTDMICGGDVDVLVQGIRPGDQDTIEALGLALRLLEKGGKGVLVTGPLPEAEADTRTRVLFLQNGAAPAGSMKPDSDLMKAIQGRLDPLWTRNIPEIMTVSQGDYYLEPLQAQSQAAVFGGGHISLYLAPLLQLVGFDVVVVDDREEFANPDRFPNMRTIVTHDWPACFDQLDVGPSAYYVVVTRGHLHDKTVLGEILKRPYRYVGMIGSRRKRNMVYDALIKEGIGLDRIKDVHSPIGLSIGAETPEEIAVSIVAEMILVRSEGLRLIKDWKV